MYAQSVTWHRKIIKPCRICLDSDNPDEIISSCLYSTGSTYVHRKCLNHWRAQNAAGKSFKFCDIQWSAKVLAPSMP